MVERADRCDGCGLPVSETTDPENEQAYDATVLRCFACAEKARQVKPFTDPGSTTAGLLVGVRKVDEDG